MSGIEHLAAEGLRSSSALLFGQTMGLVAVTSAFFALGGYVGRNASYWWGWLWFVAAFGVLVALYRTVGRSERLALTLLFTFGLTCGLAIGPTLAFYASLDTDVVWTAAVASAFFIAACAAVGFATQRDLSALPRIAIWLLVGLFALATFDSLSGVPTGGLIYAVVGLVVFAGLTMYDFQRLRRSRDIDAAPLFAASIFLDIVNVFLLLVGGFGGTSD
jgi:modulator of FtsH protease